MPLVGTLAVFAFNVSGSLVAFIAATHLRPKLQGREPCKLWFVFFLGTLASTGVFVTWIGTWGIGAVHPGLGSIPSALSAGLVWGGFFAFVSSRLVWRAFDPPSRDYEAEKTQMMNTDV